MADKVDITKIYDAPIEKVFDAWTQADQLMAWHAPGPLSTPDAFVDLSVGGKYYIAMQEPEDGDIHTAQGVFKEVVKPTKLVFTWIWKDAPAWAQESVVTVLLKEIDSNKTELQLIHEFLPSEDEVQHHGEGWNAIFEKLTDFLKIQ